MNLVRRIAFLGVALVVVVLLRAGLDSGPQEIRTQLDALAGAVDLGDAAQMGGEFADAVAAFDAVVSAQPLPHGAIAATTRIIKTDRGALGVANHSTDPLQLDWFCVDEQAAVMSGCDRGLSHSLLHGRSAAKLSVEDDGGVAVSMLLTSQSGRRAHFSSPIPGITPSAVPGGRVGYSGCDAVWLSEPGADFQISRAPSFSPDDRILVEFRPCDTAPTTVSLFAIEGAGSVTAVVGWTRTGFPNGISAVVPRLGDLFADCQEFVVVAVFSTPATAQTSRTATCT